MKKYEFTGNITLDDYVQMNRYYIREFFLKSKIYAIILILALFAFIGMNIYSFITYGHLRFLEDILPILIFVFAILFIVNRPKFLFKKYYAGDKTIKEERIFRIDDNTINVKGESFSTTLSKEKINRIKHDKDTIYIFTAENALHIIKKRYLKDENEFDELKMFLKENYIQK
jgi:hypothetical protein